MPSFRSAKAQSDHAVSQKVALGTGRHDHRDDGKIHSVGTARGYGEAAEHSGECICGQENSMRPCISGRPWSLARPRPLHTTVPGWLGCLLFCSYQLLSIQNITCLKCRIFFKTSQILGEHRFILIVCKYRQHVIFYAPNSNRLENIPCIWVWSTV